jgi:hypothetical protein
MLIRGLVLALVVLLPGAAFTADLPQKNEDVTEGSESPVFDFQIRVNKAVGLTPLKVKVLGVLLDKDHNEVKLAEGQKVSLEVEASHYRIVGGAHSSDLVHAGYAELDSAGVKAPMDREIVLKRSGTYLIQMILTEEDGTVVRSNKVKVKAM